MLSSHPIQAPRVVDPHNYLIPDIARRAKQTRLGNGCYRTRPTTDLFEPGLGSYDVVMTADQVIRGYVKT